MKIKSIHVEDLPDEPGDNPRQRLTVAFANGEGFCWVGHLDASMRGSIMDSSFVLALHRRWR